MPVNLDKPQQWKADITLSVDFYNSWFLRFAPKTYRETRVLVTEHVAGMLQRTNNLRNITTKELREHPGILPSLRMSTAPPLARDRLIGLAGVTKSLVETMERDKCLPPRMVVANLEGQLAKIAAMIMQLADVDIFPWLLQDRDPTAEEGYRGATIVADRLIGCAALRPILSSAMPKKNDNLLKSSNGLRCEATRTIAAPPR